MAFFLLLVLSMLLTFCLHFWDLDVVGFGVFIVCMESRV